MNACVVELGMPVAPNRAPASSPSNISQSCACKCSARSSRPVQWWMLASESCAAKIHGSRSSSRASSRASSHTSSPSSKRPSNQQTVPRWHKAPQAFSGCGQFPELGEYGFSCAKTRRSAEARHRPSMRNPRSGHLQSRQAARCTARRAGRSAATMPLPNFDAPADLRARDIPAHSRYRLHTPREMLSARSVRRDWRRWRRWHGYAGHACGLVAL